VRKAGNVPLIDLLYQALRSDAGVVVETNNPERLRAKLYDERKADADLACISISLSRTKPESELLLVKNTQRPPKENA